MKLDRKLKKLIESSFTEETARMVISFLNLFSEFGQIPLINIFLSAKRAGRDMGLVIEALDKEWRENWRKQPKNIRGSLNGTMGYGLRNRESLENLCRILGLRFEFGAVPEGPIEVLDSLGHIHNFGGEKNGQRSFTQSVSNSEECDTIQELSICPHQVNIINLKIGEPLVFADVDDPHKETEMGIVVDIRPAF